MRHHDTKYQAFECGEGLSCNIIGEVLGAVAGPLIGGLLGKREADQYNEAAQQRAEAAAPSIEVYGPAEPTALNILSEADRLYGQGGFAPPINPLQTLGLKNQLGYAEGLLPEQVGAAQEAWRTALDPTISPYIRNEIAMQQGLLAEQFAEDILPRIASNAQAARGFGGSRQGVAEAGAVEGLLRSQGEMATRGLADAYRQELQAQQNAINQAGQMALLGYLPGQGQQMVGDIYQQQARQPAENLMGYQGLVAPYTQPRGLSSGPMAPYQSPTAAMLEGAAAGRDLWDQYGGIFGNPAPSTWSPSSPGWGSSQSGAPDYRGGHFGIQSGGFLY